MRKIHVNSKKAVAEETETGEDHRVPDAEHVRDRLQR